MSTEEAMNITDEETMNITDIFNSTEEAMNITDISKLTPEQTLALFKTLKDAAKVAKAAIAEAKPKAFPLGNNLYARVSKKGAVSIYGLGKFPANFFVQGAERLFAPAVAAKVLEFVELHRTEFTAKPTKESAGNAAESTETKS